MRSGRLDRKIVIEQKTASLDSYGGQTFAWTTFATVWASVQPLKGRELIASQAAQSEITARFVIRYLPGVTDDMRISYGGKYWNISAVIDIDEHHREMHLLAGAGLNEG